MYYKCKVQVMQIMPQYVKFSRDYIIGQKYYPGIPEIAMYWVSYVRVYSVHSVYALVETILVVWSVQAHVRIVYVRYEQLYRASAHCEIVKASTYDPVFCRR